MAAAPLATGIHGIEPVSHRWGLFGAENGVGILGRLWGAANCQRQPGAAGNKESPSYIVQQWLLEVTSLIGCWRLCAIIVVNFVCDFVRFRAICFILGLSDHRMALEWWRLNGADTTENIWRQLRRCKHTETHKHLRPKLAEVSLVIGYRWQAISVCGFHISRQRTFVE